MGHPGLRADGTAITLLIVGIVIILVGVAMLGGNIVDAGTQTAIIVICLGLSLTASGLLSSIRWKKGRGGQHHPPQ